MSYTWGSKTSGTEQVVGASAILKPGRVYKANYMITGLQTMLPGWEENVAAQIRNNLSSRFPGCQLTYINIDSYQKTASIEFTYTEGVTPHIEPLTTALVIIVCVTIIAGLILTLAISGNIKEILIGTGSTPGVATQIQNIAMYAAIGVVAIAGVLLVYKVIESRRGGYATD